MRQDSSCRAPIPGQVPEPNRRPHSGRTSSPAARKRVVLGIWLLLALVPIAVAHPIPDVPLRSFFEADGSAVIRIELDTRCFSQDPEAEPYLFLEEYLLLSEAERDRLRARARAYADKVLQLSFEPGGVARPQWEFEFTTFRGRPLTRADDPVMLTGSWRLKDLSGLTGYQARSLPAAELSLLFLNYYQGKSCGESRCCFPMRPVGCSTSPTWQRRKPATPTRT